MALDTETDSPAPTRARLVGMSFSLVPGEAYYVPVGHDYLGAPAQIPKKRALEILKPVLEDAEVRKTGQNIKYDLIVLEREGVRLAGLDRDTMVLSYLLEPNWGRHGLEKLALHYLRETKTPYEEIAGKGKNGLTMDKVAVERAAPYACQDAALALELGRLLWDKVRERKLDRLYEEIERPLVGLLARMEVLGVRVDPAVLKAMSKELEGELKRLEKEIHALAGGAFNINSPRQLADVLFHKLGLAPARRTRITKGFSTSVDVLEDMAGLHPMVGFVLEYRQMAKLKSTYADALPALIDPDTGRIHTSYNQTVASTGRLSSSEPNLQNIPARGPWGTRFRRAFVPDEGHLLLAADYSQIELRVLAHLSGDETLIGPSSRTATSTRRPPGSSSGTPPGRTPGAGPRSSTSASSTGRRRSPWPASWGPPPAKPRSSSTATSPSGRRSANTWTGSSTRPASGAIPRRSSAGSARSPSCACRTGTSSRPAGASPSTIPSRGRRPTSSRWPCSGPPRRIDQQKLRTRMILQVHDELVFEVPVKEKAAVEPLVREAMEGVAELRVPLKVRLGFGPSWADAK